MAQGDRGLGRVGSAKAHGRYKFDWGKVTPDATEEQVLVVTVKGSGGITYQRWERQEDGDYLMTKLYGQDVTERDLRLKVHATAGPEGRAKGVVENVVWPRGYEQGTAEADLTVRQQGRKANLNTGDFVAELASVMRTRYRYALPEGDFIEDVERAYTDGQVFAEEERRPSDVKLQITLSMDRSKSTFANGVARIGGRAFIALDKTIRKAQLDLPEGCLSYQPFTFAGRASAESFEGVQRYNGQWWTYTDDWTETKIAPLFERIQRWERVSGDSDAFKLDIIITDGVLEHRRDVADADRIQVERNGRGAVVMLNFLERKEWGDYHMPARAVMYEVNEDNLEARLRTVIAEVAGSLL